MGSKRLLVRSSFEASKCSGGIKGGAGGAGAGAKAACLRVRVAAMISGSGRGGGSEAKDSSKSDISGSM
jgi:hypothetical protein